MHNDFFELDQSPNHTMTYNPTITLSNNDTYTSQQCLSNSSQLDSFTIMTLLQFYNDDFYNTDFWHDLILDLTLLLWTLAVVEVLLCFLQVMVDWHFVVLLVCVWVVLLCPPFCTCINEQDPNQYTNKILPLSCKTYVKRNIKNSNLNTFNIYEQNPIKHKNKILTLSCKNTCQRWYSN